MAGVKRKALAQSSAGAKRTKVATEHVAPTEPAVADVTPLSKLLQALHKHHDKVASLPAGNVVHWFRSDLRLEDNRALHASSEKAKENGNGLIALYIVSPQVSTLFGRGCLTCRIGDFTRQLPSGSTSYCELYRFCGMILLN